MSPLPSSCIGWVRHRKAAHDGRVTNEVNGGGCRPSALQRPQEAIAAATTLGGAFIGMSRGPHGRWDQGPLKALLFCHRTLGEG